MKHCILAKFRPEAGDWRAYLPQIREIFSAAGDIPGVRGAEVLPGCVDRDNRYHVLFIGIGAMIDFGPLLEKKAIFDYEP